MGQPSGKIVAKPMIVRSCGHQQEFQHYEVDKYRAQRLAKFQSTRCADCVAKLNAEQQEAAGIPKPEAIRRLPAGAQVSLTLRADGCWAGTLTANGVPVETVGAPGAGPQAVVGSMAVLWLASADNKEA